MKQTRLDFLSWAALTAAIVVTASGEYQLGIHAGFGPYIAAGIPAALDIYALRAMRARRDVAIVVLAMIAVNALSHLVSTGLLPVNVPLVVAVSAIAPLVFWRVHLLAHHGAPVTLPAMPAEAPQSALDVAAPPAPKALPVATRVDLTKRSKASPQGAPKAPPVDLAKHPKLPPQSALGRQQKAPRKRPGKPLQKRPRSVSRTAAMDALEALYQTLQKRPREGELVDELKRIGYRYTSRQHANKLRKEIEKKKPHLAAIGSPNVHSLTAS